MAAGVVEDDTEGPLDQPLKVLEGWGGTCLPDPPARLRRAADEGRAFSRDDEDAAWAQRRPSRLRLPKYSTFLGIECKFLLKDKQVSQGMLAIYHGHTLRIQGVDEACVTYSLSAGVHSFNLGYGL